jgi:glycosyltransferase involved in cell wall biosynthesis
MRLIENSIDTDVFNFSEKARHRLRNEWGIAPSTLLIGMVARYDPIKDHETLLHATRLALKKGSNFTLALVGGDMVEENAALISLVDHFGLRGHVKLLGSRQDIPNVMSALDIHVLSSVNEAAPTVVLEAMACGALPVSTEVGDCREIVGDEKLISQVRDPGGLSEAIQYAITLVGKDLVIKRNRKKIEDHYSIFAMTRQYQREWGGI